MKKRKFFKQIIEINSNDSSRTAYTCGHCIAVRRWDNRDSICLARNTICKEISHRYFVYAVDLEFCSYEEIF